MKLIFVTPRGKRLRGASNTKTQNERTIMKTNSRTPKCVATALRVIPAPKWVVFQPCLLASLFLALALNTGAVTNTWTGGGGDDNWSTPGNWDIGALADGADVVFTANDGVTGPGFLPDPGIVNNVVDSSRTLNSLWYQPSNHWHVTEIPAGVSLSVTGALAGYTMHVGYAGSLNNANNYCFATLRGAGGLMVNNPDGAISVRIGIGSSGAARAAHLDLSGLDTFTADLSQMLVGGEGSNATNRPGGVVYLAKTNVIRGYSASPSLVIGDGAGSQGGGTNSVVNLGQTNVLLFDSGITVGGRRNRAILRFTTAGDSVAYFRNLAGTGRQTLWALGDNNTGGNSAVSAGTNDFSAGTVDAWVDTVIVGRGQTSSTGSPNGSGTGALILGAGRLDLNTLEVGFQRPGGSAAIGVVETSGGPGVTNLIVNGNARLGHYDGLAAASATVGTLNIGSTVIIKGNLISGGSALNAVTVNNGHLIAGGIGNDNGINDTPLPTLNLESGTLTLDLGTASNPTTPVCQVTNLYVNSVTLNVAGAGLSAGVIPLLKVHGGTPMGNGFAGIVQGTLPPKVVGSFSNSTDTLYLVIAGVDIPKWNGNISGDWDIGLTANWLASYTGGSVTYQEAAVPGDPVRFDDTASGITTVNLTTTLSPQVVAVDNALKNYTFTGSGSLSGAGGLNKLGPGTLLLANSGVNDFTGPVSISGGKLQLGGSADRLPVNAAVTLADVSGAVLDLNSFNQQLATLAGGGAAGGNVTLGAGTLTLSGDGGDFAGVISGGGKLVKTNAGTQILSRGNTYSGGTVVQQGTLVVANASGSGIGSGDLLIEGGTLEIGVGDVTGSISQTVITNHGTVALNRSDDFTFGKLLTGTGGLLKEATNTVFLSTANDHTGPNMIAGGALRVSHPQALGVANNMTYIYTDATARLELINDLTLGNTIQIGSKGGQVNNPPPAILNVSGTNTLNGLLIGAGGGTDFTFVVDDGQLTVAGAFTNSAGGNFKRVRLCGNAPGVWHAAIADGGATGTRLWKDDAGTWLVTSTNTYTGETHINLGTLVLNGAILNSSYVNILNGLGSPAVLAGDGYIAAPVTNGTFGVLSPGASIGTLTIGNRLVLQQYSSCEFEVSTGGYDQVRGLLEVSFGGTLNVTVIGNLAGVEVFKLFDAVAYSGSFHAVNLPPLPAPLDWDATALETQGLLRVTGGIHLTGGLLGNGNMQLTGSGPANYGYRVLAATNVALPLNEWSQIGSGSFASDGSYSFTDVNTGSHPRRFYRVVSP